LVACQLREGDIMSVSFYGLTREQQPVMLDPDDSGYLNMASSNARVFLEFLGLEPGVEPSGETTIPLARRAIMRARATFERNVKNFVREESDTKRPGQCRVIEAGLPPEYFSLRLDSFEKFLNVVAEKGATSIYWA
jgi:hypothetical protein